MLALRSLGSQHSPDSSRKPHFTGSGTKHVWKRGYFDGEAEVRGAVSLALLQPDTLLLRTHPARRRKSGLALLPRSALSGLGALRNRIPWRLADRTGRWCFG